MSLPSARSQAPTLCSSAAEDLVCSSAVVQNRFVRHRSQEPLKCFKISCSYKNSSVLESGNHCASVDESLAIQARNPRINLGAHVAVRDEIALSPRPSSISGTTALWITTDKKEEELGLHLEHPCFPFPPSLNRKWEGRWKGVGSFLLNPTRNDGFGKTIVGKVLSNALGYSFSNRSIEKQKLSKTQLTYIIIEVAIGAKK
uniref:Uncharacterized protein n=1 Tax=Cucumis melo TaxID=3656 RepID=A0A9I9EH10_CUCME